MTDELDEILRDYTPNLTSEQGDPDAYDAEDCIEYPHSQTARRNDTHDCLTCGQPECKPWYKEKQAIQALIAKECNKARINELEKVEIYDDSDMTQEYLLKRITALKEGLKK